jgi:hypothetical protein
MAYADRDGATRVVFLVSDAAKPVTAVLLVAETATSLRDPFTSETLRPQDGKLSVAMPPRGVRMLIVE